MIRNCGVRAFPRTFMSSSATPIPASNAWVKFFMTNCPHWTAMYSYFSGIIPRSLKITTTMIIKAYACTFGNTWLISVPIVKNPQENNNPVPIIEKFIFPFAVSFFSSSDMSISLPFPLSTGNWVPIFAIRAALMIASTFPIADGAVLEYFYSIITPSSSINDN